jgi:hypothetical protein
VIAQPFSTPLAESERTFASVVDACDRWRAGKRDSDLRFFIEQTQLLADVARFLPERDDKCAAGYGRRIDRMVGGRTFGLVLEEYQAFDAELWMRLRDFLRGLYDVAGMPAEAAKATLFLGNYAATPWGLHRGRSGNFQFVVEGPKRIRAWPDEYWRGKEDMTCRLDYHAYDDDSVILDGRSGDVLYWPHDHWHVGEAVGGTVSVAISVAIFMDDDGGAADLLARTAPMVRQQLSKATESFALRPSCIVASLPVMSRAVSRATSAVRVASEDSGLARRLLAARLNHATGYGFGVLPAPLPLGSLDDDALVCGTPKYPILWILDGEDLICSANGHAFTVTASSHIVSLFERLNEGEPYSVGELVREFAGTVTVGDVVHETAPETVRALLEKLVSFRAIRSGAIDATVRTHS